MGEERWQIRNLVIDTSHIQQISVVVVLCFCIWKLTVSNIGWFWKLRCHRGVQDCPQCAMLCINT